MAERIDVTAPGGSYPILIERGLLPDMGTRAGAFGLDRRVAVITNETLAPLYGEALCDALPDAHLIVMPDGEQYKNLNTVANLYQGLVRARLDRKSTVIGLGGGVVGDTAGFAAATYMRGVRLVQIPTSLLAMVDSSVGGKVGVDLPEGKNLVGAFKQPELVLIDPNVLYTLPPREWRCGLGEVIKHGLLADPQLLEMISPSQSTSPDTGQLVRRAVQVKVDLVQQDPYEENVRAYLNLGHTFAHAIEQVTHYQRPHGEAVATGLVAAAWLSARLGLCDTDLIGLVEAKVASVGLPIRLNGLKPEQLWAAMATDKKWQAGNARFVLLKDVGQPTIIEAVEKDDVIAILEGIQ